MPDPNLTGALKGSLESFSESSPLTETDGKNAVDEFLDRINEDLVAGAPDRITDQRLENFINLFRAEALRWTQEEARTGRAPRGSSGSSRKSTAKAIDIEY